MLLGFLQENTDFHDFDRGFEVLQSDSIALLTMELYIRPYVRHIPEKVALFTSEAVHNKIADIRNKIPAELGKYVISDPFLFIYLFI